MAAAPHFEVVQDDEPSSAQPPQEHDTSKAVDILLFLLKPLAQRTVIALSNLFALFTCASVFWLAFAIIPKDPSVQQLIGLGGYATFVGIVNLIVRRK